MNTPPTNPICKHSSILDLQLLHRYMSPALSIEALLEGSNIDDLQLNTPDTHITLAQKLAVFTNALANTSMKAV